jgi:hypothetical protein
LRWAHLDVRADPIPPTDLGSRQRQTIGGTIRGAVSDDHDVHTACQPAACGPGGRPPMVTHRVPMAPAVLLEAAHELPPRVVKALEPHRGRIPGITQHIGRATAPTMAGVAEPCQGQRLLRGPACVPPAHPARDATRPLRPDQHHQGETIDRLAFRAGEDPGEARDGGGNGLGITVSSRMRSPRSQTNSVRQARSRRACPDQSACSHLVKRSWDTVFSASAGSSPHHFRGSL